MIYWTDWDLITSGNPFKSKRSYHHYIEGSVPAGMKLKKDFDTSYVLKITKEGGIAVPISNWKKNPMVPADLERARAACKELQEQRPMTQAR